MAGEAFPRSVAAIRVGGRQQMRLSQYHWRERGLRDDGWAGANVRTTFAKIVRRAGVEPWPRLWQSLRASCESDLAQSFPLATVTKWLGNTPSVALRHYVDPTKEAFDRALDWRPAEKCGTKSGAPEAQNEAQQVAAGIGGESQESMQPISCQPSPQNSASSSHTMRECLRECMGIEPTGSIVHTPHWF